jgi:hypothetical protein
MYDGMKEIKTITEGQHRLKTLKEINNRSKLWDYENYLGKKKDSGWRKIVKEGWDVFPPWLMALNIFAIVIGLAVILFI